MIDEPVQLLGVKEVLLLTGLSRSTLNHHRFETSKSPFPEPRWTIANSPIWHPDDVTMWLKTRDSRRGRPAGG